MPTHINEEPVGETTSGQAICAYTLVNDTGLRATFLNYGGILAELEVPDSKGIPDDITLGLDDVGDYIMSNPAYFGALIGRFANRIKNGKCKIDGKAVELETNEGKHHLHGGSQGFASKIWDAAIIQDGENQILNLALECPDGEMGFPGDLRVRVRISLTPENGLKYQYEATTTKTTILNLTAHPYFNLASHDAGSIRNHIFQFNASKILPTDEDNIPTGKMEDVADGPFDFREPQVLDPRLDSPYRQVEKCHGFDHNFVIDSPDGPAVTVYEESSGRKMEIFTDQPGVQFYTGNFLDGSIQGKNGIQYERHAAFCLETQHFPDSPNHKKFPSTELKPGETFQSFTEYRFSSID